MYLPPEQREKLKDFPPVCERIIIPLSECSPHETVHKQPRKPKVSNQTIEDVIDKDPHDSQSLLVSHLKPVENYVVNLEMLQLQMRLGYVVTKVHRAISYDQSPWLRPYIEFNTAKRREAKLSGDKFLSNFFKLANNAVYGRTMMNVREFSDYRFAFNQESAYRYVTDSAFRGAKIINENLVGCQMQKKDILLNQPIFLGVTILDYSKMVMVDFFHNKMRKFYGDRVKLLYTDTDSQILAIDTEDVFEDLQHPDLNDEFDFYDSKRNSNSVPYMTVGKMKLEDKADDHLEEFVGVETKVYAVKRAEKDPEKVKEKEIYKTTSKGFVMAKPHSKETLDIYRDRVFANTPHDMKNQTIQSKNHRISTMEQVKYVPPARFGNKRFGLPPDHEARSYSSVPFGYNST